MSGALKKSVAASLAAALVLSSAEPPCGQASAANPVVARVAAAAEGTASIAGTQAAAIAPTIQPLGTTLPSMNAAIPGGLTSGFFAPAAAASVVFPGAAPGAVMADAVAPELAPSPIVAEPAAAPGAESSEDAQAHDPAAGTAVAPQPGAPVLRPSSVRRETIFQRAQRRFQGLWDSKADPQNAALASVDGGGVSVDRNGGTAPSSGLKQADVRSYPKTAPADVPVADASTKRALRGPNRTLSASIVLILGASVLFSSPLWVGAQPVPEQTIQFLDKETEHRIEQLPIDPRTKRQVRSLEERLARLPPEVPYAGYAYDGQTQHYPHSRQLAATEIRHLEQVIDRGVRWDMTEPRSAAELYVEIPELSAEIKGHVRYIKHLLDRAEFARWEIDRIDRRGELDAEGRRLQAQAQAEAQARGLAQRLMLVGVPVAAIAVFLSFLAFMRRGAILQYSRRKAQALRWTAAIKARMRSRGWGEIKVASMADGKTELLVPTEQAQKAIRVPRAFRGQVRVRVEEGDHAYRSAAARNVEFLEQRDEETWAEQLAEAAVSAKR